jgi:hypothetical protein
MSELVKLEDVVSISGIAGLHKVIGRVKNGLIVEALDHTKKKQAASLASKVSVLSEISMYSKLDEVKLNVIFKNIHDNQIPVPEKGCTPADLKAFMKAALPDYDEERVYLSNMEKLAKWYFILKDHLDFENLLKEETVEEETPEVKTPEVAEEVKPVDAENMEEAPKPKKKAVKKKTEDS